jgi:hypothetical protein
VLSRSLVIAGALWALLAASATAAAEARGMIVYTGLSAGKPVMMAVDLDGGHRRKLIDEARGSISADGTRVAYADRHGVAISKPDGSHARYVTHAWSTRDALIEEVLVSPNGRRVAFEATRAASEPGQQSDYVLIANVATGSVRSVLALHNTLSKAGDLTWSPSSRQLAFDTNVQTDAPKNVYVADAGSGAAAPVTDNVVEDEPCVTPDATRTNLGIPVWGTAGLAVQANTYGCVQPTDPATGQPLDPGTPPVWSGLSAPPTAEVLMDGHARVLRTLVADLIATVGPARPGMVPGDLGAWSANGTLLLSGVWRLSHREALAPLYGIAHNGTISRLGTVQAVVDAPLSSSR